MKTPLLSLVLSLSGSVYSTAQDYLPLPTSHAEWSVLHTQSGHNGRRYTTWHYAPLGDTIIRDEVFTRLYGNTGKAFDPDSAHYIGAYTQEAHQVLFVEKDSSQARILYDLDIPIGWVAATFGNCDTSSTNCMFAQLSSKDTVSYPDEIARLRYNFEWIVNEGDGSYSRQYGYSWIEGIGSTLGFFPEPDFSPFFPTDPIFFSDLLCFRQNDALVYTNPILYEGECYKDVLNNTVSPKKLPAIKIYPNPCAETLFIDVDLTDLQEGLYVNIVDVVGRVVLQQAFDAQAVELDTSQISPGIYYLVFRNRNNIWTQKLFKTK